QWLATRTPTGWNTEDITPPPNITATYQAFNENLTTSIYQGGETPVTENVETGCPTLYTRTTNGGGFGPLFSRGATAKDCGYPLYAGASQDETHIIFQDEAPLTGGEEATVPPEDTGHHTVPSPSEGCMFGCNLYDETAGQLKQVNILDGETVS